MDSEGISEENMQQKMAQQQKQAMEQQEEQRKQLLSVILETDARERLARVSIVKPERARQVENQLINTYKMSGGQMKRVTEQQVIAMLGQASTEQTKTKIIIQRKKGFDSDDDYGISSDDD